MHGAVYDIAQVDDGRSTAGARSRTYRWGEPGGRGRLADGANRGASTLQGAASASCVILACSPIRSSVRLKACWGTGSISLGLSL